LFGQLTIDIHTTTTIHTRYKW